MRPLFVAGLLLILQSDPLSAQAMSKKSRAVADQLVIGLGPGADVNSVLSGTGIVRLATISGTAIHLLELPRGTLPAQQSLALARLRANPNVRFAEPNSLVGAPEAAACNLAGSGPGAQPCTEAVVNGNPTSAEFYDQNLIVRLNVPAAQDLTNGFPSLVAVIDTGIDLDHALFEGRLWSPGHDFVLDRPFALDEANGLDDDGDGFVDEGYGHGTHVAGVIVLINPDAFVLPLRVLDSDGNGTAFDVASAIYEATFAGATVINLSLSMTRPSRAVSDAVSLALASGIDVFAAAGNDAGPVLFPARQAGVVAVGAVDDNDLKADFSAFGPEVSVSAPGVGIFSAYPGSRFAWWSGTSMACAVASGAASLTGSVADEAPIIAPSEALITTSISIDALNPGYSGLLGHGRIDAYRAALAALPEDPDGGGSGD